MTNENYFEKLNSVNVTEYIEKKGRFNYLSWAYAVRELKKVHPKAYWEVEEYNGAPYAKTEAGCFVKVTVFVDGLPQAQIHPVLDNKNNTIEAPNAFQINTSIQRCLAKAIALHGLGIYIYAGEDLPGHDDSHITHPTPPTQNFKIEETATIPNDDVKCPACKNAALNESDKVIGCSDWKSGCKFSVWKNGSDLNLEDIKTVLSGNNSRTLTFQLKDGSLKDASLYLDGTDIKRGMPVPETAPF
tara:strand:+ start:1847 stop:2578 length:732 start_codon:yes stop_codon:yes gene_type:complete